MKLEDKVTRWMITIQDLLRLKIINLNWQGYFHKYAQTRNLGTENMNASGSVAINPF